MDYKDLQTGKTKDFFWLKAKNELISILMRKACGSRKQLKILNIGVGTGDDLEILNNYGKNYLIDIDEKALSIIDNKKCEEKKIANACNLPYTDDFFDIVVSFDVFEHIENDRKSVDEVYRVLKKDGILIFTVPAFQFLFSSHDKALLHKRRYDKKGLKKLLAQFNLKIFFWNSILFLPMAVNRAMRKKSKPKIDQINLPPWLNTLFFYLFRIDNFIISKNISMPIGSSIVGLGFKKDKKIK